MQITNTKDVSLLMAVWLLHDEYDYINEPNYISATTLLKSIRQIVLGRRVIRADASADVTDFIASSLGTAVHDSVEKAWHAKGALLLQKLGYPSSITDRIVINPSEEYLKEHPDALTIFFERRAIREIAGFKVGGKFDSVMDGRLFDIKTTSVWTYIKGRKDEDYALQGGLYRWLNPELIVDDHIYIQFVFTDWQKMMTRTEGYPDSRIKEYPVLMKTIPEIETFLTNKLNQIKKYMDASQADIPECTETELWQDAPTYKYYSDPTKTDGRASKNFDNALDANRFKAEKGKGIVITKLGEPKACLYCPAFDICEQRKRILPDV